MRNIRVGIIGFGYMGNFHLNHFREIVDLEVVSAYDIDPEKLLDAKDEGLHVFSSLEEFLKQELDLVVVATPNDSHKDLVLACLNAGKHCLCEKPVAMNIEELDEMIDCAKRNNRIFTVHQNRRWDKDFLVVKEAVASGKIGNVTTIISQTFGERGICFGWRAIPEKGGGMVYDWGIHLFDQLLMLFRERKVIGVYSRLRSILTPSVDDYFEVELEFEDDIIAHVLVGTFALQRCPRWFVFGDKGTLKLDDFSGEKGGMSKIKDNIRKFKRVSTSSSTGPSRTMAHLEREDIEDIELPKVKRDELYFHRNLVDSISGGANVEVKFDEMRRDMLLIQAVFESSKKGEKVRVSI
ncbi:MAG: Gfo/Idh/MocA family oxidoreductase [Lachnospiraceae bacterium]|nr:Gfo/Idh/MocA family oxidoreductase [Lachnospiraceae bacterium]